ncbi:MAG: cell envelope integrity protein TolA [Lysobacterales bacterium]
MAAIETSGDRARAWLLALVVHLAAVGLMFVGLWWTRSAVVVTPPGPVIEAVLVGPAQAPKPRASKPKPAPPKREPKEEPKVEPKKVEPTEPVKPDTREQERVAALAAEKAETEKKEQEERKRQQQVLLEEEKKRQEAAEKKKKLEEEKQQQLADKKARELADKQKKLEQQRLQELLEAEEAKTGGEGKDDSLLAQYIAAIQNAVTNNWLRPDSAPAGLRCTLHIIQIPGGEVISAKVSSPCNADAVTRDSIEQAVMRASPLPYQGFEQEFQRDITFNFRFDG